MSTTVWADPAALDRFAAGSGNRTTGIEAAKTAMVTAVSAWNRADNGEYGFCLDTFGDDVDDLVRGWVMTDDFAAQVAQAFREADALAGAQGVVFSQDSVINRAMAANLTTYNPISSIEPGDRAEWATLTGANVCYAGGKYGGGGFVVAPDGVRYPLVIPETKDGKHADDGGPGDVSTLDGTDPGWYRTGVYATDRQLFGTDDRSAFIGGALLGLTGGEAPDSRSADPDAYKQLVVGPGRPKYFGDGEKPQWIKPGVEGVPDPNEGSRPGAAKIDTTLRGGGAGAGAAQFALNSANQAAAAVKNAKKDAYGSYQLITERNVDGRVRARLTVYRLVNHTDGSTLIVPVGVSAAKGRIDGTLIHYRKHAETGDPRHDADPKGDHIVGGSKNGGFWHGGDQIPTYQDK